MAYSGGTYYIITPHVSNDINSTTSVSSPKQGDSQDMAVKVCPDIYYKLPSSPPTVYSALNDKENDNDDLENYLSGTYAFLEYLYKLNNTVDSSNDSCLRIDWEENPSVLHKKAAKNKKHTNKVTTTLKDQSNHKVFQKRRRKKMSLFNTEERFDDKMPYLCFECKKFFGLYRSLDEHENSHALWKE